MKAAMEYIWRFPGSPRPYGLFALLAALSLGAVAGVALTGYLWLLGIPVVILLGWLTAVNFRPVFYMLIASIPISIEMELPGGLATDLASEPFMWLLTLVSVLWFARNWPSVDVSMLRHPITIALFFHLSWIAITAVTSQAPVVSIKYMLAKGWYVIVFYFLAYRLIRSERAFLTLLWAFFIPLVITVLIVLARHSTVGFAFDGTNFVMGPFYRNHVIYACIQAIFIPFVWYGTYFYKRWSARWWILVLGILIMLLGINFAYTRAAYVALLAAFGIYWIIRWRMMKPALALAALLITLFYAVLSQRDNWLLFAPDYERTITHKRFDNLLEATTKLEDISVMERVYRWVAASYMVQDRPITGFGPGTFYFYYKNYTVSSFKTYVSDNPERSGIHNYFLMTTVEQGLPGLVLFVILVATALLYSERLYHRIEDPTRRRMLLSAVLCFSLINLLMLMNDFVETDKIGGLFFISMAMIVRLGERQDVSGQDLQDLQER
jgi:O-antigen ligase